ncbi:ATP-binding cassette domain-containing protein [Nocardiopsis flavescens]|uniref:ABC-2 type transport system ATP-binding protein n=1 Tax=Nocardiopsis flavescens TaxID=758803 RepID=A0A1M6PQE3_9ACTN|nr:ATP-binding cassette domain-containing protein [Nocardiopsis flavescens]SHK10112.1 ABC-2 type transport system ATP-binding protein [Nocardiopsis flavescens]
MISVEELGCRFRVRRKEFVDALKDVSFVVGEGELVALLGPNGAGKSTTLRVLTGLVPPSSGRASVAGTDVVADPTGVRRRIGFVGQGNGAAHEQRVDDELHAQGRAYGLPRSDVRATVAELVGLLDLGDLLTRPVRSLSGGQRRRVDIALGLVPRPPVLFLDEPTTGLDPHHRARLWEHIDGLRRTFNTTILLTTHYLEEADEHAERVLVIDHGRVIADDTSARLKREHVGHRVSMDFDGPEQAALAAKAVEEAAGTREVTVVGRTVNLRADGGDTVVPPLLAALEAQGTGARRLVLAEPTLNDVFLELTGRSLREGDQYHREREAAA